MERTLAERAETLWEAYKGLLDARDQLARITNSGRAPNETASSAPSFS